MSLRSHVHADKVLAAAREHPAHKLTAAARGQSSDTTSGSYGRFLMMQDVICAVLNPFSVAGRYTTDP